MFEKQMPMEYVMLSVLYTKLQTGGLSMLAKNNANYSKNNSAIFSR